MDVTRATYDVLSASLELVDPHVDALIGLEEERQTDKIILIPSESMAPRGVRQALGSVFTNIYAEGYPSLRMTKDEVRMLLEFEQQMAFHRRYADRRYYKGTEYVNFVEALAQRRVAELFATDTDSHAPVRVRADRIFANVQALSGAAANNAVYEALLQPGDTVLGMSLVAGGHLTHGSPLNRSGKYYRIFSYGVSRASGRLDYDEIATLAQQHQPRLIIAGGSAYPWEIDWVRLREIADSVPGRAYLLADIAHPAGLVVAGLFPNPVGLADAVSFTTHKTMLGPRGAVILSTDESVARRIDRAVFPGEQGGPHINNIAAMAVSFKIAQSPQFQQVQEQTVANAQALAAALQGRGLRLAYGGTNTHLLLLDLNGVKTATGYPLKGDVAARILDVCGIVCNKNTIPGDTSAADASAIRMGTTWATQRGLAAADMERLAGLIHRVISSIRTFRYFGPAGDLARGKAPFEVLQEVQRGVTEMVNALPTPSASTPAAHPAGQAILLAGADVAGAIADSGLPLEGRRLFQVTGERSFLFVQGLASANLSGLAPGQRRTSWLLDPQGRTIDEVEVLRLPSDPRGRDRYLVACTLDKANTVRAWMWALSDGYVLFDPDDLYAKIDGPVLVQEVEGVSARASLPTPSLRGTSSPPLSPSKPYFIGQRQARAGATVAPALPECVPGTYEGPVRNTCLYEEHLKLTVRRNLIPFAGWSMPVWYTSIGEEHQAVREAAGLFDISHMGVLEISGPGATRFLDLVTTNYVPMLEVGQAQYSYVLDPDGGVMDDVFIYKRAADRYMVVVNAANAEKITAWLQAVNSRQCLIDRDAPDKVVDLTATIRDLKDPASGADRKVDLALQGPRSRDILQGILEPSLREAVAGLARSSFVEGRIGDVEVLIARTGYTGEEVGYELYVHPDEAPRLWDLLLEHGRPHGIRPTGLGARDSCRTEAGFPLYGHELAGPLDITPSGAGYGAFVKLHKPFFIGKAGFQRREAGRTQEIIRFRMNARAIRMVRPGDPVVNKRGEVIGAVTSCVLVSGVQTGLAYLKLSSAQVGTTIGIFILPRDEKMAPEKPRRELQPGDKVLLHEEATILNRFMTGGK